MPLRRYQTGSALGEKLIVWAVIAFYGAMLVVAFSQSLATGFAMIGLTIGVGALIMAYAYNRERRQERERVDARLSDLEQAALAHGAVIEALFMGHGEGGAVAVFGVAGAAGKIFFARETYGKDRTRVVGFDEVAAAFARPDGESRYRLEVRSRPGTDRSPRPALFLGLDGREEAERWVAVLKPHLGERARLVGTADETDSKSEGGSRKAEG